MALDPREGLSEFTEFKGLRNTVDAHDFGPGDLSIALNVDIDDAETIARRKGYSTAVVVGVDRDLFAHGALCVGVGSNTLKRILPDYSTIELRSGLPAGRALSYCPVADRIYYSAGALTGAVSAAGHRSWGLVPPALGTHVVSGGGLLAGRYQWTATYVRSDGQESGAPLARVVDVPTGGGFTVSVPASSDPDVVAKWVYVSTRDGQTLYRYTVVANATTEIPVLSALPATVPLETQFLVPSSALGSISHMAYGNGHLLVAVDNRLFVSEPYAPELFDPRKVYPFPDRITLVSFLEDGAWIGTDSQIAWIANADIDRWEFKQRAKYGAIPGTAVLHSAEDIGEGESKLPAVLFASAEGLCAGLANGQFVNFTKGRFAYPKQAKGAGVVRDYRGSVQYLVSLNGPETPGNTAN